jgi:hypothetical protein
MSPRAPLGVVEFSRQLIQTGDLDPLYIALWNAKLPKDQLCRWLVAYWCFYHAGVCCIASEDPDLFAFLLHIAESGTKYPRGTERRHFRGTLAVKAILKLQSTIADADSLIDYLLSRGLRADAVMEQVQTLYGFGTWIAGKVPDMLERLDVAPVQFVDRDVDLMFDSPKKAAIKVSGIYAPSHDPLMASHKYVLHHVGELPAPPRYERLINVQETETCFCKWGASLTGHYPLGKDTLEIRHGLLQYPCCVTTQKLLRAMPTTAERG